MFLFFFQAEDGIRDLVRSRGLGDVYKRQIQVLPLLQIAERVMELHPLRRPEEQIRIPINGLLQVEMLPMHPIWQPELTQSQLQMPTVVLQLLLLRFQMWPDRVQRLLLLRM